MLSVFITFLMLYLLVKLLRSLVLKKIEGFFLSIYIQHCYQSHDFWNRADYHGTKLIYYNLFSGPFGRCWCFNSQTNLPIYPGANIGTTVTALLAALTGTVSALVAAFSHLLFNIFGITIIYGSPSLGQFHLPLLKKFLK
ncbi:MAG: hypothetical protein Ct9H300mP2_3010 [Candidatus Neomarinimicrobiota bacterium]|nr:MAG: hypothetical protein Ct9H300mP2_3010 [Candidatus Neomarinimicrobiota bacterium]